MLKAGWGKTCKHNKKSQDTCCIVFIRLAETERSNADSREGPLPFTELLFVSKIQLACCSQIVRNQATHLVIILLQRVIAKKAWKRMASLENLFPDLSKKMKSWKHNVFPLFIWCQMKSKQQRSLDDTIPDICHFFTQAKLLENKIYTKKRQFFALNM